MKKIDPIDTLIDSLPKNPKKVLQRFKFDKKGYIDTLLAIHELVKAELRKSKKRLNSL